MGETVLASIAMSAQQLIILTVVVVVSIGGAAAIGAASPADAANESAVNATDVQPPEQSQFEESPGNASVNQANASESVGPTDGLPSQVPDHVSEIHDRIDAFLDDSLANLGESLSELLGNMAST